MAFRNLYINSKALVRGSQQRIILKSSDKKELSIPVQDIGSIVLDNTEIIITQKALTYCAENNVAVFVTNDSHLPIGVNLSFQNHSRQSKQIKAQLSLTKHFNQSLWTSLVKQKLINGSRVLEIFGRKLASDKLLELSRSVRKGDETNRESVAAQIYFSELFGEGFLRRSETKINSALNYGFAIVRGVIARHISAYGLLPSIGVHHKNEYNNFNLADDLIEPFRPVVEYMVRSCFVDGDESDLSPKDKAILIDILHMATILDGKEYALDDAVEQVVKSLVTSMNKNSPAKIKLPNICELKRKLYE